MRASNQVKYVLSKFIYLFSITIILITPQVYAQTSPISDTAKTAMTENQRRLYELELGYFADVACPPGDTNNSTTAATALIGSDNAEKAFNFFVGKGLSSVQAAGIIGNFLVESNVNPEAINDGSGAYGIAQWLGGRRIELFGKENYNTLQVQLDYVWEELTGDYKSSTLDKLTATSDLKTATDIVLRYYEIPCIGPTAEACFEAELNGEGEREGRLYYAEQALNSFGTGDDSATNTGTLDQPAASADFCNTSSGSTLGVTEAASQFIDGIEIFSQTDPLWSDIPYGDRTIGAVGCGVTAMATIITALTGIRTIPPETAKYADDNNLYEDGTGSSWLMPPKVAANWNLTATQINPTIAEVTNILNQGGMVITSGQGALPFSTTSGHYIVIRAVTAEGKWMIADSSHAGKGTNTTAYDPQFILNIVIDSGRANSMYGITDREAIPI